MMRGEREEYKGLTLNEAVLKIQRIMAEEKKRYASLYQIPDHFDPAVYTLVIDTTGKTKDEVFEEVCSGIQDFIMQSVRQGRLK